MDCWLKEGFLHDQACSSQESEETESHDVTTRKKRKYIESYLAYGFIQFGDNLEPKAQCATKYCQIRV